MQRRGIGMEGRGWDSWVCSVPKRNLKDPSWCAFWLLIDNYLGFIPVRTPLQPIDSSYRPFVPLRGACSTIPTGKDTYTLFCFRTWISESWFQYTYTCVKHSEHHRFWIRYTYLAFFSHTFILWQIRIHIHEKCSWLIISNWIRIRVKIVRNFKCIYSRAHGSCRSCSLPVHVCL